MPRTIAAILRHGAYEQPEDVPSAFLPHPLTEAGREQASQCALGLVEFAKSNDLHLHPVVDTSRMLRAWESGSIICQRLTELTGDSFSVAESDSLAERSLGAAANLTVARIAEIIDRDPRYPALQDGWKATADFKLPLQGAESLREGGARVAAHIEQSMNNLTNEVTGDCMKVFVGHGAAFRYAAVKLGVLTDEQAPGLSMFHCVPVYLERDSSGTWSQAGGEWKVRKKNLPAMD